MAVSVPLSLYKKILEALDRSGAVDTTKWTDEPPITPTMISRDRGKAPPRALHLHQLYIEFDDALSEIRDERMRTDSPYRVALDIVHHLITLLVTDKIVGNDKTKWVITSDGRLYELTAVEPDDDGDTPRSQNSPKKHSLTLVYSR